MSAMICKECLAKAIERSEKRLADGEGLSAVMEEIEPDERLSAHIESYWVNQDRVPIFEAFMIYFRESGNPLCFIYVDRATTNAGHILIGERQLQKEDV
jgi:hypothetical protein